MLHPAAPDTIPSRKLPVDNKSIAAVFNETADLMEINGDDSFRIRSYRRAADTREGYPRRPTWLMTPSNSSRSPESAKAWLPISRNWGAIR